MWSYLELYALTGAVSFSREISGEYVKWAVITLSTAPVSLF